LEGILVSAFWLSYSVGWTPGASSTNNLLDKLVSGFLFAVFSLTALVHSAVANIYLYQKDQVLVSRFHEAASKSCCMATLVCTLVYISLFLDTCVPAHPLCSQVFFRGDSLQPWSGLATLSCCILLALISLVLSFVSTAEGHGMCIKTPLLLTASCVGLACTYGFRACAVEDMAQLHVSGEQMGDLVGRRIALLVIGCIVGIPCDLDVITWVVHKDHRLLKTALHVVYIFVCLITIMLVFVPPAGLSLAGWGRYISLALSLGGLLLSLYHILHQPEPVVPAATGLEEKREAVTQNFKFSPDAFASSTCTPLHEVVCVTQRPASFHSQVSTQDGAYRIQDILRHR